jgi:hypothetical protein
MRLQFAKQMFRWVWQRVFGDPTLLKARAVEELPDRLELGIVYVVGEGGYLWFVAMICPCGCGETLHMNLMSHSRPRWEVIKHNDGSVTLDPSISRLTGCRSHFFLRRCQIVWWHAPRTDAT